MSPHRSPPGSHPPTRRSGLASRTLAGLSVVAMALPAAAAFAPPLSQSLALRGTFAASPSRAGGAGGAFLGHLPARTLPVGAACARPLMSAGAGDGDAARPTTFVPSDSGLVEVASLNAKREFIVDEHLMASHPERLPAGPFSPTGSVALVGAGPGDPDLLTVKAVKELEAADLVIADRLVSREILALVKCELRVARKHPGCAAQAQREIYRWCFEALAAGKRVVRLKIGDPFVFGRGGEEVVEFRRFGVEPTIVPGISSALAGPMAAMTPVTHRGVANKVTFCTGMDRFENTPIVPAFDKEQTLVLLMSVGRLGQICEAMIAQGYPPDTPVGICERATTPQQREIAGTIANIARLAEEERVRAPAIIVVGDVVGTLDRELGRMGAEEGGGGHAVEWLEQNGLLSVHAVGERVRAGGGGGGKEGAWEP